MEPKQRHILLTGATGGIGQAFAKKTAESGAKILLAGRNKARLNAVINSLPGEGHLAVPADLMSPAERAHLLSSAIEFKINSFVNLAGINELSFLTDLSERKIEQMISTNLTGAILLTKSLIPHLLRQPESEIVNVGSILGSIGYAGSTVYCATKFGLRGFTESLRRELADTSIRVIYFAPRATDTAMNTEQTTRMNKSLGVAMDAPELVAEHLLNVLNRVNAKNHYMGWPEKFFVRLNGLFPGIIDKALFKQLPTVRRFSRQKQATIPETCATKPTNGDPQQC